MKLLYSIFEGVWRSCFGCDGWDLPILKYRFVQHIIGFVVTYLFVRYMGYSVLQASLFGVVLQGLMWSRSHGDYFSIFSTAPDEGRIKWIDWVLKKIYGVGGYYNFKGNFTGMLLRYTAPAILLSIIVLNPILWMCGLFVPVIYTVCWWLYDKGVYKIPAYHVAEAIMGLEVGLFIAYTL